ncbi:hemerythrin domain-containing protein [Undibacterium sp. TJN25]|uniref:hemerythrin domain-containing protein n=1 Tax=Undibacterium sp. TJN25 TaxID=3413056 RepID=UPI003BF30BB6
MDTKKFKHDHGDILAHIHALRMLVKLGIAGNATAIARMIVTISSSIKLHLAVEDRVVYPAFAASKDPALAEKGARFQAEMGELSARYMNFAGRWNTPLKIAGAPEEFREEANTTFKALFERTQRENEELYPALASL